MTWTQSEAQQKRRSREVAVSDATLAEQTAARYGAITTPFKQPYNPYNPEEKKMETPTHAITVLDPEKAITEVRSLYAIVSDLYKNMMKPNLDYGVIPGTGSKPTLLLPGMEKLMRALNAVPRYIEKRVITDYDEDKPLFHYEYECQLIDADTGQFIPGGIGIGLCTSMESAFRWRKAERICPDCGQPAIIKGKAEYGGGWLCFKKKGGCGAKFDDNDTRITDQETGRVQNPDIFDQVNAICKRAQKRALASAIKGAAAVSEFFTVDLEDFIDAEFTPTHNEPPPPPARSEPPSERPAEAWNMTALTEATKFLYTDADGKVNTYEQSASLKKHTNGDNALIGANDKLETAIAKLIRYKTGQVFDANETVIEPDDLTLYIHDALDSSYSEWRGAGKSPADAWACIQDALKLRFPEDTPF